jgi:adenylylsulfate kinase
MPAKKLHANRQQGLVVWLTGLSGSGKSTIANTAAELLSARGVSTEVLDGDLLRKSLSKDLGFSKVDRDEHVSRVGFVANVLSRFSSVVFVALVSPYTEARKLVRDRIPNFIEVYVNAPLQVCEDRDVKGLYRLARAGVIPSFTGVSDPYEPPAQPHVECRTGEESLDESVGKVLASIDLHLYLLARDRSPQEVPAAPPSLVYARTGVFLAD